MDTFFTQKTCSRCRDELTTRTMSKFNEDILCMNCAEAEKKHPLFNEAGAAELAQVKAGNYNFPGLFAGRKYPFNREGS